MMDPATMPLLSALTSPGQRATKIADVICRLIVDGGKLGELREITTTETGAADGKPWTYKAVPADWMPRLALAVERGAFDRMPDWKIIERILMPREGAAS